MSPSEIEPATDVLCHNVPVALPKLWSSSYFQDRILHTFFFFLFFFHLTYSRWTSSLPSCLWSQRIFPSLPGSRLTIFLSRDASSAFLQLVNQWLNLTCSRSHAFRYERKNTNPTLVRIELTTSVLADVQLTYYLDHSGDERIREPKIRNQLLFHSFD